MQLKEKEGVGKNWDRWRERQDMVKPWYTSSEVLQLGLWFPVYVSLPTLYTCLSLLDINLSHQFSSPQCLFSVDFTLWGMNQWLLFLPGHRSLHVITITFFVRVNMRYAKRSRGNTSIIFNFMHNHTWRAQAPLPPADYAALRSKRFTVHSV